MPRKRRTHSNFTDISIKEFADADKTNGRIRKGVSNVIREDAENDDYEVLDIDDNVLVSKKKHNKSRTKNRSIADDDNEYTFFPNDIWFLISEYIQPEDILRFALICKQTYTITTTLKFWRNLYRRYYNANVELPVRLQMHCMARPKGIRACAIRSLFYTYTPFTIRVRTQQDFHLLVKHRVVHFWYEQVNAVKFMYFYKLKRKLLPGSRPHESDQLQRKNGKTIKGLRDVYCNTEEGCSLLMIESTKFHPLPRLELLEYESNVILSSIANHLSRSCSHYRLEMQFSNVSGTRVGAVVYEPASSIRVYDWWSPTYSKYVKHGLQPCLEYVKDEKDAIDDNWEGTNDDAWDYVINNF